MEKIKYYHGSEDSLDKDVVIVFDKIPTFKERQELCKNKKIEDKNIIVIKDGIVVDCHKGTPDELNNAIYDTYKLHKQEYPLLITRKVERDILIKYVRVIRCILSHCSRTIYRTNVKKALSSHSLQERIKTLEMIDLTKIDDFGKHGSKQDVYKILAFQLGQAIGLNEGIELYTKSCISLIYDDLRPFIYRVENSSPKVLNTYISRFCAILKDLEVIERGNYLYFPKFDKEIDLVKEQYKKDLI